MNGRVQLFHDSVIRGPYKKDAREYWLRRVLETQTQLREIGPDEFRQIELVTMNELQEIRRLWRFEKHEFDDSVPRIYHEATGEDFPIPADDDNLLRGEDWQILKEVCGEDPMFFELQSSLLDVEREYRGMSRRAGIYEVRRTASRRVSSSRSRKLCRPNRPRKSCGRRSTRRTNALWRLCRSRCLVRRTARRFEVFGKRQIATSCRLDILVRRAIHNKRRAGNAHPTRVFP